MTLEFWSHLLLKTISMADLNLRGVMLSKGNKNISIEAHVSYCFSFNYQRELFLSDVNIGKL